MRRLPVILAAIVAVFGVESHSPAWAQNASPQQIQGLIASGQEQTALSELQTILQAHPDSGVAWYLTAEAQDAAGNESAARSALSNAQHDAPGLPFAKSGDVAALQAHLSGGAAVQPHAGISPVLIGVIFIVVLFLGLRMFRRRRLMAPAGYPAGYNAAGQYPGGPGYGPGYGQSGMGGGMGSGLGGSLLGGLAAGAGFVAGERVLGDIFGNNNNNNSNNDQQGGTFQQDQNSGNGGTPDRDDGLNGNPGWDDGSNNQDNNFDPGNSW